MKAILTKYRGPGNVRGSRIHATDSDGNRTSVSYDDGLSTDANHRAAAVALCHKMGWKGVLVQGALGRNEVFVWLDESATLQLSEVQS